MSGDRKNAQNQKDFRERGTGFEPATFCLEGRIASAHREDTENCPEVKDFSILALSRFCAVIILLSSLLTSAD
jgi:hypothetical protein